jgi:uncharacterized protein (TIGR02246 family)
VTTELILDGPPGDTPAGGSDEILRLFDLWNEALTGGDPTRVTDLYGPGAVLVPTLSNTLRTTRGDILTYFEKLIRERKPRVTRCTSNVWFTDNTAINSGIYTFHFDADGSSADARYTFAYQRAGSGWLISAHHSSLLYREMVAGKGSLDPSF